MPNRLAALAQGLVVTAAVVLAAARFVMLDAGSHSASDTLRPWLIETAPDRGRRDRRECGRPAPAGSGSGA